MQRAAIKLWISVDMETVWCVVAKQYKNNLGCKKLLSFLFFVHIIAIKNKNKQSEIWNIVELTSSIGEHINDAL